MLLELFILRDCKEMTIRMLINQSSQEKEIISYILFTNAIVFFIHRPSICLISCETCINNLYGSIRLEVNSFGQV